VQVDPIKITLKAPRPKCLKVKYDKLLSSSGFKFNLRRYSKAATFGAPGLSAPGGGNFEIDSVEAWGVGPRPEEEAGKGQGLTLVHFSAQPELS